MTRQAYMGVKGNQLIKVALGGVCSGSVFGYLYLLSLVSIRVMVHVLGWVSLHKNLIL